MAMMLKPRLSSQWAGKRSPGQKKSTDESIKEQCDVGCVFIAKALSTEILPLNQTVLPGNFNAFGDVVRKKRL